jgi:hypothetical protein
MMEQRAMLPGEATKKRKGSYNNNTEPGATSAAPDQSGFKKTR